MSKLAEAREALQRLVDRVDRGRTAGTPPRYIEEVVMHGPLQHAKHIEAVLAELESRPSAEDMAEIDAALGKIDQILDEAGDPGAPAAPLLLRPGVREIQLKAAHIIDQLEAGEGPRNRMEAQLLTWAEEIHAMAVAMLVRRDPPEEPGAYDLRDHCRDE